MPSGPKKRKTAKKKKEEDKLNSEGNNDEGKIEDEKGSDSCDSLSSYNHDNHGSPVYVEDYGLEYGASSPSLRPSAEDHGVLKLEMASDSAAKRSVDPRSSSSDSSDDDSRVSRTKSEAKNPILKTNSDEQPGDSFDLIVQTSSVLCSIPSEVPASEEAIATAENASTQNSVIADVITSDVKETEKTPMPVLAESAMDSASENPEQKSSPPSSNGSTEILKSVENQPSVASARWAMQKTSFLSCCGLFDAVSSSSR